MLLLFGHFRIWYHPRSGCVHRQLWKWLWCTSTLDITSICTLFGLDLVQVVKLTAHMSIRTESRFIEMCLSKKQKSSFHDLARHFWASIVHRTCVLWRRIGVLRIIQCSYLHGLLDTNIWYSSSFPFCSLRNIGLVCYFFVSNVTAVAHMAVECSLIPSLSWRLLLSSSNSCAFGT